MSNYLPAKIAVNFNVSSCVFSQTAKVPFTSFTFQLLSLFLSHGLIQSFSVKGSVIEVRLKYFRRLPVIKKIKVISTPGHRVY